MKIQFFDQAGIKPPDGRYFVLQNEVDPPPPGSPKNEACVVCIIPTGHLPKCESYSYRVRASLTVTVHGSISCADPLRPARRSTYPPDAGIRLYGRAPVAGEGCVEVERNHERKENPNTTLNLLVSLNGVGYHNMLDGATNTVQFLNFLKKLRIQSNLKRSVKVGERCLKSTLLKWELSFYIRLCTLQISIPRNCVSVRLKHS